MGSGKKLFFSAAVLLAFFGLFELLLAIAGYATLFQREDPYLGFAVGAPLFVPQPSDRGGGSAWVTASNKRRFFNAQSFRAQKEPGTRRVFCVGGSSVHGHPYDHRTSFCGWLAAFLPVADPSRSWEIVNAGGISYASYRVALLMQELVTHEPDLFVVYTGHNEFLEKRTYPRGSGAMSASGRLQGRLGRTRTYSLMADLLRGDSVETGAGRPLMAAEVSTLLGGAVGPTAFARDDAMRDGVVRHYRLNLERIIGLARGAGAEVLLVTPAANLSGMSPFKSELGDGLSLSEGSEIVAALDRIRRARRKGQLEEAHATCQAALEVDDRHADLHYECGHVLLAKGEPLLARQAFWRAVEEDVCPLRALPAMRDTVLRVAAAERVPVVDFGLLAEQLSEDGVPGGELFLDHVHPSVEMHRALALAILASMNAEQWIDLTSTWSTGVIERLSHGVRAGIDPGTQGLALRNLAIVFGYTGKFEESDRVALQALALVPGDAQTRYLAGTAMARRGELAEAARHLRRAVELQADDLEVRSAYGWILLRQGDSTGAVNEFRRVLVRAPRLARAHSQLGLALLEQGKLGLAKARLEEALRLEPRLVTAVQGLDRVRARQGKLPPGPLADRF